MKKNNVTLIIMVLQLFVLFYGCNNDNFSPIGALNENYATFCILDNRLSSQFVRINKIYYSENDKSMPASTKVILSEVNGKSYMLKDTIINENQRESIYYLPSYQLSRGKTFKLTVVADGLPTQTASVYVFAKPKMTTSRYRSWSQAFSDYNYTFSGTTLKERSSIYLYTGYIEFEIKGSGKRLLQYMEIPTLVVLQMRLPMDLEMAYRISRWSPDTIGFTYPVLSPYELKYYNTAQDNVTLTYDTDCIRSALKLIQLTYGSNIATVKRGIFVMYIIDPYLFENFFSLKADRYSVRLDEAYYSSNFTATQGKTALGYLGCVVADTSSFKLYDELLTDYKLFNGQE
jgi:hypothetical protein